jgi:hypothetical protein
MDFLSYFMAGRKVYAYEIEQRMKNCVQKVTGGNPCYLSYWKKVKILDRSFEEYSSESLKAHWILMRKRNYLDNERNLLCCQENEEDQKERQLNCEENEENQKVRQLNCEENELKCESQNLNNGINEREEVNFISLHSDTHEKLGDFSRSPFQKNNIESLPIVNDSPLSDPHSSALNVQKTEAIIEKREVRTSPIYTKILFKPESCSTLKKKNMSGNTPSLEKIEEIFENLVDICSVVAKKRLIEAEVIQVLLMKKGRLQEVVNYFKTNH